MSGVPAEGGRLELLRGAAVRLDGFSLPTGLRSCKEDKRKLAGWGGERIADALAARGIERSDIEAGLGGGDEGDELERAVALLAGRGVAVVSEADRGRALGYLARRGYSSETAHEAVRGHERRSRDVA
jgi:SOS response regulatory protein OraA/RecX